MATSVPMCSAVVAWESAATRRRSIRHPYLNINCFADPGDQMPGNAPALLLRSSHRWHSQLRHESVQGVHAEGIHEAASARGRFQRLQSSALFARRTRLGLPAMPRSASLVPPHPDTLRAECSSESGSSSDCVAKPATRIDTNFLPNLKGEHRGNHSSMRKREAENVAFNRERDVLDPIDCIRHR